MTSFKEKYNALKVRLENNQDLDAFCQSTFGQSIKVLKTFKERTEISLNELPIALITRPQVRREFANQLSKKEHSIFIYAGFHEEDKLRAADISIEFEELIEAAIQERTAHQDDRPMAIMPSNSTNDEGRFHTVYFFMMEAIVKDR